MPDTLPAGADVRDRISGHPGKVVAATDPTDPPPGPGYVRVKSNDGTREWVAVADLEQVNP